MEAGNTIFASNGVSNDDFELDIRVSHVCEESGSGIWPDHESLVICGTMVVLKGSVRHDAEAKKHRAVRNNGYQGRR